MDMPNRRLAAIMFTDMVGYTAMMEKDEPRARELIERHRNLMKPLIEKHGGKVLQFVGDGTFCTFSSAIEATNSSIEIQRALKSEKEISIRIGIHIGDVVSEGDEVYGDGVNVASRLEPLAAPGGICISGEVSNNLKNQPGIETVFLGKKKLKNVEHLVEVYALAGKGLVVPELSETAPDESPESVATPEKTADKQAFSKKMISIAAMVLTVVGIWFLSQQFGSSTVQEVTADENSLAVLFIENMIDPEDSNHEAEMLKELLITDLSQSKTLQVISSQRLYDIAKQERGKNGKAIDRENASQVARIAGAQWMLTGKLAQFGERKILTTQIANVRTGKILNAQRADGNDFFLMVDDITNEVREHLGVEAADGETDLPVAERTTDSKEAYQYYAQGQTYLNRQEFAKAVEKFEKALKLDSDFTQALYNLAMAYWWRDTVSDENAIETLEKMLVNEEKLTEREKLRAEALLTIVQRNWDLGISLYKELTELNPDDKEAYYGLGESYFHAGGSEVKALDAFEKVLSLDPTFTLAFGHIFDIYRNQELFDRGIEKAKTVLAFDPGNSGIYREIGHLYRAQGKYDLALESYNTGMRMEPDNHRFIYSIIGTYRRMGEYDKALEKTDELAEMTLPAGHRLEALSSKAGLYKRLGRVRESIVLYNQALLIDNEDDLEARDVLYVNLNLARNHSSIGDFDKALMHLNELIERTKQSGFKAASYLIKGMILLESDDRSELRELANISKDFLEKNKTAFPLLDLTYLGLQFYQFYSVEEYDAALLVYSNLSTHPEWRGVLAYYKTLIHIQKEEYDEALRSVAQMENPNVSELFRIIKRSDILYLYGRIYEAKGETSLAVSKYRELLEFWKDADDDLLKLIDTKKRLANLEKQL